VEAARIHLRRLPLEIARGLDLDELASRDVLALADVDLPASGLDEGPEPLLPVRVDWCTLTLPVPPVGERDLGSDGAEGLGRGDSGEAPLDASDVRIGE